MAYQSVLLLATIVLSTLSVLLSLFILLRMRKTTSQESVEHAAALARLSAGQDTLTRTLGQDLHFGRAEAQQNNAVLRGEVTETLRQMADTLLAHNAELARQQNEQLNQFAGHLRHGAAETAQSVRHHNETLTATLRDFREQMAQILTAMRTDSGVNAQRLSENIGKSLGNFAEMSRAHSAQLFDIQKGQHAGFETQLANLHEQQARAAEALRQSLEQQLGVLRQENGAKLEQMRATVDEKLQGTLEQRLGESFKVVSDRLEAVHRGLGEMQQLATGVGDLKRVLTNVKTRGSWGEVQLGALLEQVLTANQYVTNAVMVPNSNERVEYAIKLPGNNEDEEVFLPIDAKFPIEDYERLQMGAEHGDADAVEAAIRGLELRLRNAARDISEKYVHPPHTTDFAIMFLPTEGLYAEAIRRPGLTDDLQRTYRVIVAGPTTLSAILNSLQMGFRTLAIQRRSSEVWQVLGAVKSEFGKFGPVLAKVKKKLDEAANHIDGAERRSRVIGSKLRQIEELPTGEAARLLGLSDEEFEFQTADDLVAGIKPSPYLSE